MNDIIRIKKHISAFDSEPLPIKEHITRLIEIIRTKHVVLVAGGAVRDHIQGKTPKDIDLCTSATPDELSSLLVSKDIKINPVGQAFGVTIAVLKDHNDKYEEVEIATFRTDGVHLDGRRPESVNFIDSPREDAIRRDLTINGLFYDTSDDTIIDYVSGLQDMEDGILRFIGDPTKRITEDKLRMLRYARFLCKTGFSPDELSQQAIREHANKITTVSAERIKDELDKMFQLGNMSKALQLLKDLNLLKHILPEVNELSGSKQGPPYHMEGDVFTHTCMVTDNLPEDASNALRWAAVLHDVGKPTCRKETQNGRKVSFLNHDNIGSKMVNDICHKLKFSNNEREKIVWLIENHQNIRHLPKMRQVKAKRFVFNDQLNEVNPYFEDLLRLAQADNEGSIPLNPHKYEDSFDAIFEKFKEIEEGLNKQKESGINTPKLINGNDVIETLQLKTGGPIVGKILTEVRNRLLEIERPTRKDALRFLYEVILRD